MKIKIIEKDNKYDLENEVNKFLKDKDTSSIIDIKYSGTGGHEPYSIDQYSVMIIMK